MSTAFSPLHALGLLLMAALLAAAVASDLRSRRIPNRLVFAGIVLAAGLHAVALATGQAPLAGRHMAAPLLGLLLGGAVLLPLHVLRGCGAGDVKLMAMVGAFVGAPLAGWAALYAMVAGGLLSLAWMLSRGVATRTLANLALMARGLGGAPLERTAARLPYGLAIALGAAAAWWLRGGAAPMPG